MPKSIDFNRSEDPGEDKHLASFDAETHVRMSDGNVIPKEDVYDYLGSFDDHSDAETHDRKTEAIVLSTVAGLSAAALGLAIYRLRKKH